MAIVDDDESMRTSVRMLVNAFGFRTAAFASAKDFLQWRMIDDTACLILDVSMPEIGGLELQRRLKRTHPDLPIIFITALAKDHEERQAVEAGAVAVLRKPVAENILLNTLQSVLPMDN